LRYRTPVRAVRPSENQKYRYEFTQTSKGCALSNIREGVKGVYDTATAFH
jgi:hypothetical protein